MKQNIRWGILSTAQIAKNAMIPAIRAASGDVTAVASRQLQKAQAFAGELNIPKAYGSYEELLADPEIDAIYNPLPISLHAEWSIKAAEAGKPVLCEKPLALNSKEAEQMIQAFAARNLLFSEALMYKYHPMTRKMKALVDGGAIGKLTMLHSQFNVLPPEGDIRRSPATGGGAMLDVGCYCVSVQRYLAGEEPTAISAAGCFDQGVDVNISGAMKFPSGVTGHFGCSINAAFDCSYGACGTEGRLLVDRGAMCAWPGEAFKIKYWHGSEFEEIVLPAANPYQLLIEDFQAALRTGKKMDISLNDTLANMKTIEAVLQSATRL
jgi:D-xylose 1-dehydrogenase (NADP+, D-xylono-1,5-lactone-forming)